MRVTHIKIDGHYDASARYVMSVMYKFDAEVPNYKHTFELLGTSGCPNREDAVFDLLLQIINHCPTIPAP